MEQGRREPAGRDVDGFPVDAAGSPLIGRVAGKISVLERVLGNWRGRLEQLPQGTKTETYIRQEISAMEAAIAALKFHRAELDAQDTMALGAAELLEALDVLFELAPKGTQSSEWGRVQAARARLKNLLAE